MRWIGSALQHTPLRKSLGKLGRLPMLLRSAGPSSVLRRVLINPLLPSPATSATARTLYDDWLLWESANQPIERARMLSDAAFFEARGVDRPVIAVVMPSPYFKSDYNLDLLLGQYTISQLGVCSTAVVRAAGGFREGFEASQDHDLLLRCVERLRPNQIVRIPRGLHHWRIHAGSTAASIDENPYALVAGVAAVQDHLHRTEPGAQASLIEDEPVSSALSCARARATT